MTLITAYYSIADMHSNVSFSLHLVFTHRNVCNLWELLYLHMRKHLFFAVNLLASAKNENRTPRRRGLYACKEFASMKQMAFGG